jgi:hypothetical protein
MTHKELIWPGLLGEDPRESAFIPRRRGRQPVKPNEICEVTA